MFRAVYFAVCLACFMLVACTKVPDQAEKPGSAATETPAGANPSEPGSSAPAAPAQPVIARVPAGTHIVVRLNDALSTARNSAGDRFTATLDANLIVDGREIVPRGSTAVGKVISAKGSARVKGRAKMSLALTGLEVHGVEYPIRTGRLSFEAQATKKQDALKIGAGAGIGAAIGAIAGGGKGAAIGAAAGGGAGTGLVLATKGKEVQLGVEHKLDFALKEDARIRLE